jgi:hypothetical protein
MDGGRLLQVATSRAEGSVAQDLNMPVASGSSYQFSAWVRSAPGQGSVSGRLALTALGGSNGESVATAFNAGSAWTRVQATVHIVADGRTGLRAELILDTANVPLQVDGARLVPSGLADASFENHLPAWRPFNQAAAVTATTQSGTGQAKDGNSFLRLASSAANGSLAQDLGRPLAGLTYTFSLWVRAVPGSHAPASGSIALWGLNGTAESSNVPFTATSDWTLVVATLDVQHDDHDGLRAEVYVSNGGGSFDIDGACLTGANPAVLATP